MHPMNKRMANNVILFLLEDIHQHENKFYRYTSMMVETCENSLEPVGPTIQKKYYKFFNIMLEELLLSLRWF
jgi:hypothetical protein